MRRHGDGLEGQSPSRGADRPRSRSSRQIGPCCERERERRVPDTIESRREPEFAKRAPARADGLMGVLLKSEDARGRRRREGQVGRGKGVREICGTGWGVH